MPRPAKRTLALLVDAATCLITVWLALCLRLESWVVLEPAHWFAVAVSMALALPLFVRFGLYRAIFRHAGLNALMALLQATVLYGLVYALIFTVISIENVPRTVGVIQPVLLLMGVGSTRLVARYWLGGLYQTLLQKQAMAGVLIYGAGAAGRQLAAALARSGEVRLLGFLDDDPRLHRQSIDGRTIYNPLDLPALIEGLGVRDVLLAMPSVRHADRQRVLERLRPLPVRVRTLPGLADLATGRADIHQLQELDIEDLLGREPVAADAPLLNRHTHQKVVLVTGAGGSIGSELCRQIMLCRPERLLLVDMGEHALYQVHRELHALWQRQHNKNPGGAESADLATSMPVIVPLLASVCDADRMNEIIGTWRPHTIYHAAAYKHVPLVEHNPAEGVHNNVWGTWVCAEAAVRHGVSNVVLVSTDKAVRPTNIMGASKRLAEMVLQAMAQRGSEHLAAGPQGASTTCFSMVRFGNVLGSSGSVVPLFREQIKQGGPITLTHVDMTRYFMTIPEAAQLVIQSAAMAQGGDVFVLDMGEPVRIHDLAVRMINLSGLSLRDAAQPAGDIELQITGLRPGEKLFEELLIGNNPQPTQHARIMRAQEDCLSWDALAPTLATLATAIQRNDVPLIRRLLKAVVQGYQPGGGVVDWVHLAQEASEA